MKFLIADVIGISCPGIENDLRNKTYTATLVSRRIRRLSSARCWG
jgi:hypothetical protein